MSACSGTSPGAASASSASRRRRAASCADERPHQRWSARSADSWRRGGGGLVTETGPGSLGGWRARATRRHGPPAQAACVLQAERRARAPAHLLLAEAHLVHRQVEDLARHALRRRAVVEARAQQADSPRLEQDGRQACGRRLGGQLRAGGGAFGSAVESRLTA